LRFSLNPASLGGIACYLVIAGWSTIAHAVPDALPPPANPCAMPAEPVAVGTAQWNGWGRDLENSRYQPEPAIRATDVPKLRLKWAYGYAGAQANGQATIVDGRLFVTSSSGRVYSLDARTGCTYWTYDAAAATHTAVVLGELGATKTLFGLKKLKLKKNAHIEVEKPPSAVFFGDDSGAVYALDARSGRLLWKTQADGHPLARISASPALYRNLLYVPVASSEEASAASPQYACCTFRGSIVALDIATGRIVWQTYMSAEVPKAYGKNPSGTQLFGPAGMAIETTPTIDTAREVLYVGTGGAHADGPQPNANAIVALSLADGKQRWVRKLDPPNGGIGLGGAPILRNLSLTRQILLVAHRSGSVYGLDPDADGATLWQSKLNVAGTDGVQSGPAADHRSIYAAFAAVDATTLPATGGLLALDMATGKLRWATPAPVPACTGGVPQCARSESRAVTVIPGIAFAGSMDGHLRGYSSIDGKNLWDVDTATSYATRNGPTAKGGPLDRDGPTIVSGMLYVNSGDALLAFSIDGK
jgi:polyvinyl alcohol dehydrogenase (cytochrome)